MKRMILSKMKKITKNIMIIMKKMIMIHTIINVKFQFLQKIVKMIKNIKMQKISKMMMISKVPIMIIIKNSS